MHLPSDSDKRQDYFEELFNSVPDAILVVDREGQIIDVNSATCRFLGYSQRELVGMRSWDFVTLQAWNSIRDLLPKLQNGVPAALQNSVLLKNGRKPIIELSLSGFTSHNRELVAVTFRGLAEITPSLDADSNASEKLARGQIQALTSTLDALAKESAPDRFMEHVLATITAQFGAESISVWQRDEAGNIHSLEYTWESLHASAAQESNHIARRTSLPAKDSPLWQEISRTAKCIVCENVGGWDPFPCQDHLNKRGVMTVLGLPLFIGGKVAGMLGVRFSQKRKFREEEIELAYALAHQATLALQLTRLYEQSRQSAVIAERNRIARDIHDTLAQGFTGVIVQLEAAEDALSRGLVHGADEHIDRAGEMARYGLGEARRSVQALRPKELEEADLATALNSLLDKMSQGTKLHTEFTIQGQPYPLPDGWDEHLLRIVQEALTNTLRHGKANNFSLELTFKPSEIELRVRDNGVGFDLQKQSPGFGLRGIKERVAELKGELQLVSALGNGTSVLVALSRHPLA